MFLTKANILMVKRQNHTVTITHSLPKYEASYKKDAICGGKKMKGGRKSWQWKTFDK